MDIFLLLAGLAGLWLGTDLTLRGAISIASKLGMSELIVGVAILSVGSALGSALAQIGFVLGLAGLLGYLTLPKHILYRHGSIMMGSLVVLALVGFDGTVSRIEGA